MRGHLGPAVPCEHPFVIQRFRSHCTLAGFEICKGPNVHSGHEWTLRRHFEKASNELKLIFFSPHLRGKMMRSRNCVSAEFSNDDWFPEGLI